MLQSTVNLLGSTSTVWNSQYLKKILRIPEDQLKILNNIPGWISEEETGNISKSLTRVTSQENQQFSSKSISPIKKIPSNQKDLLVDFNKSKALSENSNRKERFPLRKSSSLDSVATHKKDSHISKRSSSTSSIKEDVTIFQTSSMDSQNIKNQAIFTKKLLSKIEEIDKMQVDMDHPSSERSQFSNSAVQCKMSQDFNLEFNDFEKNAMSVCSSNIPMERESLKLLNSISSTTETCKEDQIDKFVTKKDCLGVSLFSKENLPEKSKVDVDESYLSQPVPCAQPLPESIPREKGFNKDTTLVLQKSNFSSVTNDEQCALDKAGISLSSKRKRKSRSEKSKKHKGESAGIKIEYSLEQIKNMIELVKVLHKY